MTQDNEKTDKSAADFATKENPSSSNVKVGGEGHELLPTILDDSSKGLIEAEEFLWTKITALKQKGKSYEVRIALSDAYTELAQHYSAMGGNEAAVGFVKNALASSESDELNRLLGRLQGGASGYDFINTFTSLLTNRPYDLELTLEFCYFLEYRDLHTAALDILEANLLKRPKQSSQEEIQSTVKLDGFLRLMQSNISIDQQIKIAQYTELFATYFPSYVLSKVDGLEEVQNETIVGQTLEEFESEFGLKDEILRLLGFLRFASRHYTLHLITILGGILMILLPIFRV